MLTNCHPTAAQRLDRVLIVANLPRVPRAAAPRLRALLRDG